MKKLVVASIFLAFVVIVLGAYTRLTDAGLGCPDWPGCYGFLTVPKGEEQVAHAESLFPERPVEAHKAWNEMIHRYFAAALGLFILAIAIAALRSRAHNTPVKLPLFLVALVIFQGILGMWTVTMNLKPLVVMGHLLGGFSTFSLLFLLYLRLSPYRIPGGDHRVRNLYGAGMLGLFILVLQIALGGWTSTNYAAVACTQLPICEGNWTEKLDFANAFNMMSPPSENYEFGVLEYGARMTIHVTHRIWAVVTFIYLAWFALKVYKRAISATLKNFALLLIVVLGAQVLLGVTNVVFQLPLAVAVAHNAVAACLLIVLIALNYTISRKT